MFRLCLVKPQNKYEQFSTSYLRTLLPYGGGHNNVYYRRPSQQQEFDLRRQQIDEDPSETEAAAAASIQQQLALLNDDAGVFLNGPEGLLSKYKNLNRPISVAALQRKQTYNQQKQPISDEELNRLFVSIQNIQPPIDERNDDYLNLNDENRASEQLLDFANIIGNRQPAAADAIINDNINYGNSDFNQKWKLQKHLKSSSSPSSSNHEQQQQQHQQAPVYREENMAIPYDEIEQTKKRKETKNVSVNNNGDDNQSLMEKKRLQVPSNVMNNEHSIQAPKSYQQSIINTKSSIQSKFSSLSDIYFIGNTIF